MKGMRGLSALSVLLLSSSAHADDWDAYSKWWTSHYYELDPRAFSSISCEVDSSLLDDGIESFLAPHRSVTTGKVFYKVTVSNEGHVEVSNPPLQLSAVSPSDAAAVPLVLEMVKPRYTALAEGIGHDIKGLIDKYAPPDRRNSVIEKFSIEKDAVTLSRRDLDDGSTATVIFQGPDLSAVTVQSATIGGNTIEARGTVKQHFNMVDGKYLISSWEEDSVQKVAGRQIHNLTKVTVDHQLLSGMRFPGTVIWTSEQGSDTLGISNRVEFKDCKVTK